MPDYRLTFQYNENTGATFNEVYYQTNSSPSAAGTIGPMVAARLALMHPLNYLLQVRVADVFNPRSTFIQPVNLPGTAVSTYGPGAPGTALVVILGGTVRGSRRLWMRGCPIDWLQRSPTSGKDLPLPQAIAALNVFFSALASQGYGLRYLVPPTPGTLSQYHKITKVDGSPANGTAIVTTADNNPYQPGQRVIIGGTSRKDLPSLNGHWSIISATPNTFVIPYQTPNSNVISGGNGKVRYESYYGVDVFLPSACRFGWMGTRTTKNPLTHSRGARRAVRIRTSL